MIRVAAAAYDPQWLDSWAAYGTRITSWAEEAASGGAQLLVFPEYGSMELASLAGPAIAADLEASIDAVGDLAAEADGLHSALARRLGVFICAASAPFRSNRGSRPVNRAVLHAPDGSRAHQDKLIMTRFEREQWDIAPGSDVQVFDTEIGRIGIAICYDSEFPLIGRAMAEAGAEILLVPSCTEALSGYWRVRIGSMARALENQCVVVHAPTVGRVDWSPAIDENTGAAGIYGPPDTGFPDNGILALGEINRPGWVYGDISLERIAEVRANGRVLNLAHWTEQDDRLSATGITRLGRPR